MKFTNVEEAMQVPLADLQATSPRQQVLINQHQVEGVPPRVTVKILDDCEAQEGGFVAGDVAGFPPELAARLVARGLASYDLDARPRRNSAELAERNFANGTLARHAFGNVAVEFVEHWQGYAAGEVAGFNTDLARRLCANGFAKAHQPASVVKRTLRSIRDRFR